MSLYNEAHCRAQYAFLFHLKRDSIIKSFDSLGNDGLKIWPRKSLEVSSVKADSMLASFLLADCECNAVKRKHIQGLAVQPTAQLLQPHSVSWVGSVARLLTGCHLSEADVSRHFGCPRLKSWLQNIIGCYSYTKVSSTIEVALK